MKKISKELVGETVRFVGVGIVNTAVGFAVFNFLGYYVIGLETSRSYLLCNTLTFLVALTTSFFLNSRFTFKHKHQGKGTVWKFAAVTLGTFIISSVVSTTAFHFFRFHTSVSAILAGNMASLVSVLVSMCINFLGYKFIVFHDHVENN